MKDQTSAADSSAVLQPYLSPLAVWALSVGSAIGWGSLVVTSRTYLSQAGPLGSIVGLLISFLMMLMVARHYHFLANHYPGTGGLYNYVKFIFGYDRAFLVAWFMFLVYIAIFWANATSIPLFARYFLNDAFSVGYLYIIFGYEVYLGETAAFAVVVCDVNGLKQINDTLGHKDGDEYIRAACDMLCAHYAHSPVFRIGGDEFVVLLEGQDYASRHALLETINARIEENLAAGGVVASLGMAEYAYGKDKSFYEVFKRADALMYDRKMQLKGMGAVTRD